MLFNNFAGPVFTTQDVVMFCIVSLINIGVLVGLAIFIGKLIRARIRSRGTGANPRLRKSEVIAFLIIAVGILLFFV